MPPPQITLHEASVDHVNILALLGAATFLESYAGWLSGTAILENCRTAHSTEAWASLLTRDGTRSWIANVAPEAAPIGYAVLVAEPDFPPALLHAGDVELKRLYLFSRFHGYGAGQGLLQLAVSAARQRGAGRILLGTHQDNRRALNFYHRSGFREIGRRVFQVGCCHFDDPVLALQL